MRAATGRRRRPLADVPNRPRALRTLVKLSQFPGPMTARDFMEASRYVNEPAADLRDFLEAAGLITVERRQQGRALLLEIMLTTEGKAVVEKVLEIDAIVADAEKKAKKRKDR